MNDIVYFACNGIFDMKKQTTENETLNAKIRNIVQPISTLIETLEIIKDNSISYEKRIQMIDWMPSLIESAKKSLNRLID